MTVCTASVFNWKYDDDRFGPAIVVASDRLYTDEKLGIEYESSRSKVAHLDANRLILVSGDLSINSRAISAIMAWKHNNVDADTPQIANMYGQIVAALSFERAAKLILNPLGIFTDEVISDELGLKKYGLPDALLSTIADQLQAESLPSWAIIAGCDPNRNAYLFHINERGRVSLHNDIGFVSIGDGGVHSSAYFMQLPYDHSVGFAGALVSTYFAKKRSEVAPGVGATTDMSIINANGSFPIHPLDMASLDRLYLAEKRRTAKLHKIQATKFSQSVQRNASAASEKKTEPATIDKPQSAAE